MYDICRLCLKDDMAYCFSEFSYQLNDSLSVYECYKLFTSIELNSQQDRHFSKICQECMIKLISFIDYRGQVIMNNKKINEWAVNNSLKASKSFQENVKLELPDQSTLYINVADPIDEIVEVKMELQADSDEEASTGRKLKNSLSRDLRESSSEEPAMKPTFSCEEVGCDLKFLKKSEFNEHRNMVHLKIKKFVCKVCSEGFYTHYRLKKHEKLAHALNKEPKKRMKKEEPGEGGQVPNKFADEYFRRKNFKDLCSICGKSIRKDNMKTHILRTHMKYLPLSCDFCNKGFLKKCALKIHLWRHVGKKSIKCPHCELMFVDTADCNAHQKNNHQEIVWHPCTYPTCESKFRLVAQLNNHIKAIHLNIRKFVCECGRGFVSKSNLRVHKEYKHSIGMNFPCTVCGEKFRSSITMLAHRKVQHEAPKFVCPVENCGKGFHLPFKLRDHEMAIHQGLRAYACKLCEKAYATNKYLLDHIKEIHFKSKVQCELCSSSFARTVTYRNHVQARHKDIGEERMAHMMLRIKSLKPDYEKMEYYYAT